MTTETESKIAELYPEHSGAEIAELLGISLKTVYLTSARLGLRKTREWIAERSRERSMRPDHGGIAHRFVKGLTAWNKGIHYMAGGRSAETQFKPGKERTGKAADLYKPVGELRTNKEGYMQRKINDDLPFHKRWRSEHLLIWEAVNGPLPSGHAVVFRDGDKTNLALSNLELVSRRTLMERNSMQRHGPEIAALTQLRGTLTRQINRSIRNQQPGE